MVGLVNGQFGKDVAGLNEDAIPALAGVAVKNHKKPQASQPPSRDSSAAPPGCIPEATALESNSSTSLPWNSNYRLFNVPEIQDSACLRQPSDSVLLVVLPNFNIIL
jgi:hypothetical protein